MADLAGYEKPLPDDIDGGSFRRLLKSAGQGTVRREFDGLVFHRYAGGYPHSAIRLGDYKLIEFWKPPLPNGQLKISRFPKPQKVRLFNLKDDAGETRDLSESMPQKVQELHQELMRYLRLVEAEIL